MMLKKFRHLIERAFTPKETSAEIAELRNIEDQTAHAHAKREDGDLLSCIKGKDYAPIRRVLQRGATFSTLSEILHPGDVGETILHACYLYGIREHSSIAQALMNFYPKLALLPYGFMKEYSDKDEFRSILDPIRRGMGYTRSRDIPDSPYQGETILHMAVAADHIDNVAEVKGILEHARLHGFIDELLYGAATGSMFKITGNFYYGGFPLSFAVSMNKAAVVNVLLDEGADMTVADVHGNTAFHLAVIHGHKNMYDLLCKRWALKVAQLKEAGLPPPEVSPWEIRNKQSLSPIGLAATLGKEKSHMFEHIWKANMRTVWEWGNISAQLYPLAGVDDISDLYEARMAKMTAKEGEATLARSMSNGGVKDWAIPALQSMVRDGSEDVLYSRPVLRLLNTKWNRVVFKRFVFEAISHSIYVLLLTIALLTRSDNRGVSNSLIPFLLGRGSTPAPQWDELLWDAFGFCTDTSLFMMSVYKIVVSARFFISRMAYQKADAGRKRIGALDGPWRWKRFFMMIASSFIATSFVWEFFQGSLTRTSSLFFSIAALLSWGTFLIFMLGGRLTGPFIVYIKMVLFEDLVRFLTLAVVFLGAFATGAFAFHAPEPGVGVTGGGDGVDVGEGMIDETTIGWTGAKEIVWHLVERMLNPSAPSFSTYDSNLVISWYRLLFDGLYVLAGSILLFNLFIAMISGSFEDMNTEKKGKKKWLVLWAYLLLSIEDEMDDEERFLPENKYYVIIPDNGKEGLFVYHEHVNHAKFTADALQDACVEATSSVVARIQAAEARMMDGTLSRSVSAALGAAGAGPTASGGGVDEVILHHQIQPGDDDDSDDGGGSIAGVVEEKGKKDGPGPRNRGRGRRGGLDGEDGEEDDATTKSSRTRNRRNSGAGR